MLISAGSSSESSTSNSSNRSENSFEEVLDNDRSRLQTPDITKIGNDLDDRNVMEGTETEEVPTYNGYLNQQFSTVTGQDHIPSVNQFHSVPPNETNQVQPSNLIEQAMRIAGVNTEDDPDSSGDHPMESGWTEMEPVEQMVCMEEYPIIQDERDSVNNFIPESFNFEESDSPLKTVKPLSLEEYIQTEETQNNARKNSLPRRKKRRGSTTKVPKKRKRDTEKEKKQSRVCLEKKIQRLKRLKDRKKQLEKELKISDDHIDEEAPVEAGIKEKKKWLEDIKWASFLLAGDYLFKSDKTYAANIRKVLQDLLQDEEKKTRKVHSFSNDIGNFFDPKIWKKLEDFTVVELMNSWMFHNDTRKKPKEGKKVSDEEFMKTEIKRDETLETDNPIQYLLSTPSCEEELMEMKPNEKVLERLKQMKKTWATRKSRAKLREDTSELDFRVKQLEAIKTQRGLTSEKQCSRSSNQLNNFHSSIAPPISLISGIRQNTESIGNQNYTALVSSPTFHSDSRNSTSLQINTNYPPFISHMPETSSTTFSHDNQNSSGLTRHPRHQPHIGLNFSPENYAGYPQDNPMLATPSRDFSQHSPYFPLMYEESAQVPQMSSGYLNPIEWHQ